MTDELNINFSYTQTKPSAAPLGRKAQSETTLYAYTAVDRIDLNNGSVLLIDRNSDKQMVVVRQIATALQSCSTFRTLNDHADRLCQSNPQLSGRHSEVINTLESVRDNGLLITAESVCDRLCPPDMPPATDPPPTRVFIITCDRPAAVNRLLESMLQAGNLSSHEHLFLVDDSRDTDNALQNIRAIERFNLTSPRKLHYIGANEQKQLMDSLIAELPGHEQGIRFLIDREHWKTNKSYGLARNVCLLFSVGYRAVIMDDDIICTAVESPHKRDGLVFGNAPRETDFYMSKEDMLQRTTQAAFDPLNGHAKCLGLSLSQGIRALGFPTLEPRYLKNSNAAHISFWNASSRIIMTQSGCLGDPGIPDANWIFTLDPSSTQRLLDSPGGLESAIANRWYWKGQTQPMFSKRAVMSAVTGLDNSALLPPYFPVFRNEDSTFGAMTTYLHPDAAVLDYPWGVPHLPLDARHNNNNCQPASGKGGVNVGSYILANAIHRPGISAETRLRSLVQLTKELVESSDQSLLTEYKFRAAQHQATQIRNYSSKMQEAAHLPDKWRQYLQDSLDNLSRSVSVPAKLQDSPILATSEDDQSALNRFRSYADGFANSMAAWSDIRAAAATITSDLIH